MEMQIKFTWPCEGALSPARWFNHYTDKGAFFAFSLITPPPKTDRKSTITLKIEISNFGILFSMVCLNMYKYLLKISNVMFLQVVRQVAKCKCCKKFQLQQVSENKYRVSIILIQNTCLIKSNSNIERFIHKDSRYTQMYFYTYMTIITFLL